MVKCKFAGTYRVSYRGQNKRVVIPVDNRDPVLIDGETTMAIGDTVLRGAHAESLRGMVRIVCGNVFGNIRESEQDAVAFEAFQMRFFGSPASDKRICIFSEVSVEPLDGQAGLG